ncbi:MAG: Acg family FMN-binding oxidoreductase [Pseudohaliea sp.]
MVQRRETRLNAEHRGLLEAAVQAPSSHNTQPWLFRLEDDVVHLLADRTRALPVNDPDDRELTISCGCALLNLRVAAAAAGLRADCRLLPDADDEDLLATVHLAVATGPGSDAPLAEEIGRRRTLRKRFDDRAVPPAVLRDLLRTAEDEGAWAVVVDDEAQRQAVAALVSEGDAMQWASPHWRRELAQWMHPRRRGDGLALAGIVAPLAQVVVRTVDMGTGVGAKDHALAENSPLLLAIGTAGDSSEAWLRAGQALERLLLVACGHGLQAGYLNQPLQLPALRHRLQHCLGHDGFPQVLLRLGYCDDPGEASPRRPVEAVLVAAGDERLEPR